MSASSKAAVARLTRFFCAATASDAAAGDSFGYSVAISGNTAIVGAFQNNDNGTGSGSAYLFDADPLSPTFGDELIKLTASDAAAGDSFGLSVAISGNTAIVGAFHNDDNGTESGSAYLFIPEPTIGDMNGDDLVNLADVPLFVQALVNRTAYDAHMFPVNADINGDLNQDGTFDLGDAGAFSALLGGPASANAVPEPSTFLLTVFALFGVAYARRKQ